MYDSETVYVHNSWEKSDGPTLICYHVICSALIITYDGLFRECCSCYCPNSSIKGLKLEKRYSMHLLASSVKRSPSIAILDIWITVSFLHQILDYTEMSIPIVHNSTSLLMYVQCIIHHYKSKNSTDVLNSRLRNRQTDTQTDTKTDQVP